VFGVLGVFTVLTVFGVFGVLTVFGSPGVFGVFDVFAFEPVEASLDGVADGVADDVEVASLDSTAFPVSRPLIEATPVLEPTVS